MDVLWSMFSLSQDNLFDSGLVRIRRDMAFVCLDICVYNQDLSSFLSCFDYFHPSYILFLIWGMNTISLPKDIGIKVVVAEVCLFFGTGHSIYGYISTVSPKDNGRINPF